MKKVTPISVRKSDHIRINLEEDVQSGITTGLENYRFVHRALPELDLDEVDLTLELLGRKLRAPLLISSMTGGTEAAGAINRTLATAAQEVGVAMGLGSQRAALENPTLASTFQVRTVAPDILLFANLGAIQLNDHYGVEDCLRAVEMVEADALILHLNALQEAVQPEGQTHFKGLISKIEAVCHNLPVPVIVKEVGWGFSIEDVRLLANAGVNIIDVAGAGGTSWTQVEMHRAQDESQKRLAASFVEWGISTVDSILNVHEIAPEMTIFASGGLRNGVDITKCIALGATIGGMAGPFLKAASISVENTIQTIKEIQREIQVAMFGVGAASLSHLSSSNLVWRG